MGIWNVQCPASEETTNFTGVFRGKAHIRMRFDLPQICITIKTPGGNGLVGGVSKNDCIVRSFDDGCRILLVRHPTSKEGFGKRDNRDRIITIAAS